MKRGYATKFGERLKFLSQKPRKRNFRFAWTNDWVFWIFFSARYAAAPHFCFKKDLIYYLNSSRAAPRNEIFDKQQGSEI